MPPQTIFFSVVIPTLNEEKNLPLLLRDLAHQSFFLDHLEVIHVDGHSDDATVAVAQPFAKKLNLTSMTCPHRNVSEQRNLGAHRARGKWIIFMDADNRLPNYFLDGIKYNLVKNPSIDLFSTVTESLTKNTTARDRLIYELTSLQMEVTKSIGQPVTLGAMLGIRTNLFSQVQFRPEFKVAEDCEFTREAITKGFKYELFSEPTYAYNLRRVDSEGFLKQAKVQIALLLRFFDKEARTKSDFGYVMKGGTYYETTKAIRKAHPNQEDLWLESWRQTFASLEQDSKKSGGEKLTWFDKLQDYAKELGLGNK